MTDKEMAIEYRKSLKQRLIDEDNFERLEMFDENVEEAFLAGLKVKETIKSVSTETLLKELKDRGVIRSWYYNGTYHIGNELPKKE